MKPAKEWVLEEDNAHGAASTVDEAFVERVQRDAWEQGVRDGRAAEPGEGLYDGDEPVFPGDR